MQTESTPPFAVNDMGDAIGHVVGNKKNKEKLKQKGDDEHLDDPYYNAGEKH
jgi:hypothetical protein